MIGLRDLADCFEGVIPSILATSAADGTPNIAYLSHVVRVDDEHVALSNQFFAKTAANIRANPQASLLLVSARHGGQFLLELSWVSAVDRGPLFDQIADQLRASSAQVGMAGVMRLKLVDVFRVDAMRAVASPAPLPGPTAPRPQPEPVRLGEALKAIGAQGDTEGVLEAALSACASLGFEHAIVLLSDAARRLLNTVVSRGYERSGIGSEVAFDDGLIGTAAATGRPFKINDLSRIRRLGAAIDPAPPADENRTRTIPLPCLPDALSQLAVPLIAQRAVRGVLFVESRERLAFDSAHEAALDMIAAQCALALALCEALARDPRPTTSPPPMARAAGRVVHITHHRVDDSVFINNAYVIKGVAGRLLAFMAERHINEGREEFTNREIRLDPALKLPELRDNLETRLLLLRRRLDERALPVRLIHAGRGRVRLAVDGQAVLVTAA